MQSLLESAAGAGLESECACSWPGQADACRLLSKSLNSSWTVAKLFDLLISRNSYFLFTLLYLKDHEFLNLFTSSFAPGHVFWGLRPGKTSLQLLATEILDLASIGIMLSGQQTTMALIRLRGCAFIVHTRHK